MKKLSKLLALAAGLATLFFAGCSDADTDANVANGVTYEKSNVRDYTVTFVSANGEPLNVAAMTGSNANGARTIYDSGIDALDNTNWEFYLWGTDEVTGNPLKAANAPTKVNFTPDGTDTSGSTGTVALDLGSSKYKLVLAAVKGTTAATTADGVKGDATYIGYANVDTRATSKIKFVISSDGLTGESTVTLTVKFDGYDAFATTPGTGSWAEDDVKAVRDDTYGTYTINASIRSRADNSEVGAEAPLTKSDFFGTSGATYTGTNIPAGTYNFVVSFANATSGKSYEYSDTIIVLAKNNFSATVLVPDVIETAPTAPTGFKVGYIEPSSVNDGEYNVVLSWTDTSSNEKYFNIQMYDIPTTSLSATTAVPSIADKDDWDTAISGIASTYKKEYNQNFYGNIDEGWVSGSLLKNNTNVVLKLSLGHRYIMRIAAINDAVSEDTANYAYATYDLDAVYKSTDTAYDLNKEYDPAPFYLTTQDLSKPNGYDKDTSKTSTCANLYRLTYHLYGGTIKFAANNPVSTDDKDKADVVAYLTQDATDGVVIHAPCENYAATTPATPTYPSLIKLGNRWTSWRLGQVDGTKYPDTDETNNPLASTDGIKYYKPNVYKDYQNLDLFASYAVASAEVERYDDAKYVFLDGEVYFTIVAGKVEKGNDHAYTVKSGAGTVTLNYDYSKVTTAPTPARTKNVDYTSLKAVVKRSGTNDVVVTGDFAASPTTRSLSFNSTPLAEGKYTVTVTGTYNGHAYSYVIVMTVES